MLDFVSIAKRDTRNNLEPWTFNNKIVRRIGIKINIKKVK